MKGGENVSESGAHVGNGGCGLYGGISEGWGMDESKELERQACALVKQYGMVLAMAPPVKAFFKRLAVFMKWSTLEKIL